MSDFTNITNIGFKKTARPIKVIQFGEGNFLRGFVDYMIDILNESGLFDGSIVLVQPINFGSLEFFHKQNCVYTVMLRGLEEGKKKVAARVVTSVDSAVSPYDDYEKYSELAKLDTLRFVVSNTTEAGIMLDLTDSFELTPPISYPGKLTKFLYDRYKHFCADISKGLIIIPVELIDDNGIQLKKIVKELSLHWNLEDSFIKWLDDACVFTSTLVDRIITGFPKDEAQSLFEELGYEDNLIVTGEPFGLWVIESEKDISCELPLDKAGLPVVFTNNQKPYKQRKVRILNGAHTSFVLASYLAGNDFVGQSMEDIPIRDFMNQTIFEEILPTLDLAREDLLSFADAVIDRFQNPFIKHALLSISLNSVSKWRARCLPSYIVYAERKNEIPKRLAFSLASLIAFYSGSEIRDSALIGKRGNEEYKILDDDDVLKFFANNSALEPYALTKMFLSEEKFFGCDLSKLLNTKSVVANYLADIRQMGMRGALEKILSEVGHADN